MGKLTSPDFFPFVKCFIKASSGEKIIQSHWRHSGVFIVNFEHISRLVLAFLLLTFEQVNGGCVAYKKGVPHVTPPPRLAYSN